jgi:site-specific recombinase XerD
MPNHRAYAETERAKYLGKLRECEDQLPAFCADFFRSMKNSGKSARTIYAYAVDLGSFFRFLLGEIETFRDLQSVKDFTLQSLQMVKKIDIEMYLEHMASYDAEVAHRTNGSAGLARKLSAIRSMYSYFEYGEQITYNPSKIIKSPKLPQKKVEVLDAGEAAQLLDSVESGVDLTAHQADYHKHSALRDLAIMTLLLGTGIRVSELVGLNTDSFNFRDNSMIVVRKGGNEDRVYFNDEVAEAVQNYLGNQRNSQIAKPGHEKALFLSNRMQRISVRMVEEMVKKYSIPSLQKDTHPHLFRATCATNLLDEGVPLEIVSDTLGHKNIDTTRKHYAHVSDERKHMVMRHTKLRNE